MTLPSFPELCPFASDGKDGWIWFVRLEMGQGAPGAEGYVRESEQCTAGTGDNTGAVRSGVGEVVRQAVGKTRRRSEQHPAIPIKEALGSYGRT